MKPPTITYYWDGAWRDVPRPRVVAGEPAPNKVKSRHQHSDYANTDIDAYGAENGGRIRNVKKRPVFVIGPDGLVGRGTWESYDVDALYKQRAPALPDDLEIVMPHGSYDHATYLEMVARAAVGASEQQPNEQAAA